MTSQEELSYGGSQNRTLAEWCDEAVKVMEQAGQKPPAELGEEIDIAERLIVRLRDRLIDRLRENDHSADDRTRWRSALDQVNGALSLVVGVEYPAAGLQRKMLEQACAALRRVQSDGLPG